MNKKKIYIVLGAILAAALIVVIYLYGKTHVGHDSLEKEAKSCAKITIDSISIIDKPDNYLVYVEEKEGYGYLQVLYSVTNLGDKKLEAAHDDNVDKWYSYGYAEIADASGQIYYPIDDKSMRTLVEAGETISDEFVFYLPEEDLTSMTLKVSIADADGVMYRDYIDTIFQLKKYIN